jgi:PBSX family phage terminase large subunit
LSATGSGKTWLDYAYVIPKRIIALKGEGAAVILGNTQGTVKRNVLEPMQNYHGNILVTDVNSDNYCRIYGKKVYVLGADNKKHIDRIRGMTIEYAYGDEVPTWNEGVFAMLKSRLRCEHSYFDGTGNPEAPTNYLKSFIDSDVDIFCQTSTIFDNPYLPKEFVNNLCKEYEGTVYYPRYILGEWTRAEGLIYPMYETAIVSELPKEYTEYSMSIDYGTQNAFAAIIWGEHKGVWYAIDEYYYSGRDTGRQKADDDYADDMDQFTKWLFEHEENEKPLIIGKLETIIDPSATSFIAMLRKRGRYKIRKADNDVLDGIRETATAMNMGLIKVSDKLKNWKKEMAGYVWDEKSDKEQPVKEADHLCDSTRYLVKTKHIVRKGMRNHESG